MELMSPLLLCALAVLLPLALGKSPKWNLDSNINNNQFKNKLNVYDTNITVKANETLTKGKVNDLQSVFMNPTCKECHSCMEKAIKAHKIHLHMNIESKTNDVPNEIDNPEENTTQRNKRNLNIASSLELVKKGIKISKGKKNKSNKFYSVTKFKNEGKIYALKVKEALSPLISVQQNQIKNSVNKCQVYSVKESFSCESPNADLILNEKQRNVVKTGIKEKGKRDTNLSTVKKDKDKRIAPLLIKYHVDDSQVSENFMPSIEEMY